MTEPQSRRRDSRVSYARALESVAAWLAVAWPIDPRVARGMARDALAGARTPSTKERHDS